jgi:hypothetical protein
VSTSETSATEIPDLFSQVQVHQINEIDLRLLIENDPEGLIKPVVFVSSPSGSRYQLDLIGPTLEAEYYGGTAKVRQATWLHTRPNGRQSEKTAYIGLSVGEKLHLRFFSILQCETDPGEHKIMRIPSSDVLDPEIQLVIDWSKQ